MFIQDGRRIRQKLGAAVVAAFFLCASLLPGLVRAGSFQVSPVRAELSARQSSAALTVQNHGSEPVVIQLQAMAWSQDGGQDAYQPTDDLLATPPIFTIQPGAAQIVRVGLLRGADEHRELSYRLFLQEVPPAIRPDFKGLQMALRIGLPVFVLPAARTAPALSWRVERTARDQVRVNLKNEGNAHVQVTDFGLYLPDREQALAMQQVSAYVLPGQVRNWTLAADLAATPGADAIRIKAYTDGGTVEADARLEKRY
jgi:fimbrial chaperone protein